ncbi:MAG: zinc ribbon domain-containing protein [Anaerolineae bacterium]|nr:zinc ribbon domain-containing protein [Anaerolineae bacterium]
MNCPYCGEQTPDGSNFCIECGAAIYATKAVPTAWEYQDFLVTWDVGTRPYRLLASVTITRDYIWAAHQKRVLPELQKWLDAGWQPITETGVAACEWNFFAKRDFSFGCMEIVGFIWTFSLYFWIWLFLRGTNPIQYEELIGYRVKMRRPKAKNSA